MNRFFLLLILPCLLFATDYDCVIVGTSPVSLLEALYQSADGKKVLILEKDAQCGGAWRSIDACGVAHVDMGCHHIGCSREVADFLKGLGCKIVSLSEPGMEYNPSNAPLGLYFSQGCYELISVLEKKIQNSSIELRVNCRLDNISFKDGWALIQSSSRQLDRAKRIYYTNASYFSINGNWVAARGTKYYHLYLLIADAGPVRCSYRGGFSKVSRLMNVTSFSGLTASGLQLFVLQVYSEDDLKKSAVFMESLKSSDLISKSARLIREEPYIYEQNYCTGHTTSLTPEQKAFFEHLDTSQLGNSIQRHLERWKSLMK